MQYRKPFTFHVTIILALACFHSIATNVRAQASFRGLGYPAGDTFSVAHAISANGLVIVGESRGAAQRGVLWRAPDFSPTPFQLPALHFVARGVSGDGGVVTGIAEMVVGVHVPVVVDHGAFSLLPIPAGSSQGGAVGVSSDGRTVAGWTFNGADNSPCIWVEGQRRGLPLGIGESGGVAVATSSDGQVVVGRSGSPGSWHASRWQGGLGPVELCESMDHTFSSADAVSPDGRVIGRTNYLPTAGAIQVIEGACGTLVDPSLWVTGTSVNGVAGGGLVLVGSGANADPWARTAAAVVWTPSAGLKDLELVLRDQAVGSIDGWSLFIALAVSEDGRTIVGYGCNPQHRIEAWVATLQPSGIPVLIESPCRADLNRDGLLNPDDLADYINAFFATPPAAGADFDRNCDVNPDDLSDFISAFFIGC